MLDALGEPSLCLKFSQLGVYMARLVSFMPECAAKALAMSCDSTDGSDGADQRAAVERLLVGYDAFTSVCDQADGAVDEAHARLKGAYMDARATAPGAESLAALGLGRRVAEAERAAVHKPASAGTPAWNATLERELRKKVTGSLQERERLFAQVWRMYGRGPVGQRPTPLAPRRLGIELVTGGDRACAICDRDLWVLGGDGLVIEKTHESVCWVCGDEHDTALTVAVLVTAVEDSELWVAGGFPGYFEHWAALLRAFGMEQSALDLEGQMGQYQEQVRRAKELGLGDPETWLAPRPA